MEEIFTLYDKNNDPEYIGHDVLARNILDKTSKKFP
jgi:hypothetical protein